MCPHAKPPEPSTCPSHGPECWAGQTVLLDVPFSWGWDACLVTFGTPACTWACVEPQALVLRTSPIQTITAQSSRPPWSACSMAVPSHVPRSTRTVRSGCWATGGSWARGDAPLGVRAEPPPVPVSLPAGERPGAEPGLGTGYLVLIAVAVFALVAGAGALVLVHYQRMTGRYSFGAAAGGVSYQAFYE